MSEKKEEAASAPAASAPASGGGSKLVMILAIVNTVATLGMLGVLFISFQKEKSTPSVSDISAHDDGGHGEKKDDGHGGGGGHGDGHGGGGGGGGKKGGASKFGKMVSLDQFTINLSTPGSVNPKFVRVNMAIEVPSDDTEAEVNQKMPQVRNAIIDLFNSKRSSDLATGEGRDYLKDEIRNALNSFMVSGKIKGVYFTNIAVTS